MVVKQIGAASQPLEASSQSLENSPNKDSIFNSLSGRTLIEAAFFRLLWPVAVS